MRKRIIIGLLAVVVIGVAAFFVSEPKKGSAEWHKREYWAAMDRAAGRTWRDKACRGYAWITQTKVAGMYEDERVALFYKLGQHENRLVALGFLQAKEIPHREGDTIIVGDRTIFRGTRSVGSAHKIFAPNGLTRKYENMSPYARAIPEGAVTIAIGVADDIAKWEEIVRKEDSAYWEQILRKYNLPESGK